MNTIKYFKNYILNRINDDNVFITAIHLPIGKHIRFWQQIDSRMPNGNKGWFAGTVVEDHRWHMKICVEGASGVFPMTINKKDLYLGTVLIDGYDFSVYPLDRKNYKIVV